jgi:hypothetical protein
MAGLAAASRSRLIESWLWFIPVMLLPMTVRVLDLAKVTELDNLRVLLVGVALSGALVLLISRFHERKRRWTSILAPVCAVFAMPFLAGVRNYPHIDTGPILQVADWAKTNTWGSSMFLFPDAGHAPYPGVFRAESRRALWVDWKSGGQANYFESVGAEWLARWHQAMEGAFSVPRLQNLLPLPIDYYVLKREHRLASVKPVYESAGFVVYDAQDLRNASTSLRLGTDN